MCAYGGTDVEGKDVLCIASLDAAGLDLALGPAMFLDTEFTQVPVLAVVSVSLFSTL